MVIEIFIITLCLVLLIAFLWERRKWMQTRRALQKEADELKKTSYIAGAVLRSVHAFVLLIDSSFTVLNTNYYRRTGTRKDRLKRKSVICCNAVMLCLHRADAVHTNFVVLALCVVLFKVLLIRKQILPTWKLF